MRGHRVCGGAFLIVVAGTSACGDIVPVSQTRTISAATSFNASASTLSATNFAPFVQTVSASVTFPTGTGTGVNAADSTVNCVIDPNAIIASGSLAAAGGLAVVGGPPQPVFGEASALVHVTFNVLSPTPFRLIVAPRPSTTPGDEFEVTLEHLGTNTDLFKIDQTMPPQAVDFSGILQPGLYSLSFFCELTNAAGLVGVTYGMNFQVPSPGGAIVLPGLAFAGWRRRRTPSAR